MIHRECKRLAKVDFPIAEVSKHTVREKLQSLCRKQPMEGEKTKGTMIGRTENKILLVKSCGEKL